MCIAGFLHRVASHTTPKTSRCVIFTASTSTFLYLRSSWRSEHVFDHSELFLCSVFQLYAHTPVGTHRLTSLISSIPLLFSASVLVIFLIHLVIGPTSFSKPDC